MGMDLIDSVSRTHSSDRGVAPGNTESGFQPKEMTHSDSQMSLLSWMGTPRPAPVRRLVARHRGPRLRYESCMSLLRTAYSDRLLFGHSVIYSSPGAIQPRTAGMKIPRSQLPL